MNTHVSVFKPESIPAAIEIMQTHPSAAYVSGGTSLITAIRSGFKVADAWVSTDSLSLSYLRMDNDGLKIGAATTLSELSQSNLLQCPPYSILKDAIDHTASWQIRNAATLGGCIASAFPGGDVFSALLVLDAKIEIYGTGGVRRIPAERYFSMPTQKQLEHSDLITEIMLPMPACGSYYCQFRKMGVRKAFTQPIINFAFNVRYQDDTIESCRIAVGGMNKNTILLRDTTAVLQRQKRSSIDFDSVEAAYYSEVYATDSLQGSAEYKKLLCRNYLYEMICDLTKPEV